MGQQQSKDELLYQQVNYGNIESIKSLHTEGAGLEWVDKEGKTPLILASMNPQLYNVAKTLIELGANINAYRPGRFGGTPLHHAAKRGLEHTVKLLLSHGANALVMNDDCQTPLDIARVKGFSNVVRVIESHICLFSGWMRELYGPGFLELFHPQLLTRKVWVVVLPCGSRNLSKPFKLELAIYTSSQDAQPRTLIALWKTNMEEPKFNQPDPAVIISNISDIPRRWRRRRGILPSPEARCKPRRVRQSRVKLVPANESDNQQLQWFCNACKGIPQVMHPTFPFNTSSSLSVTAPPAINASLHSATQERQQMPSSSSTSCTEIISHGPPSGNPGQHMETQIDTPVIHTTLEGSIEASTPSAPPIVDAIIDDSPILYPSIDFSPVDLPTRADDKEEDGASSSSSSSCVICLDAPVEGACIPCGHMAGCMSCLSEIQAKKWGCPVCRAKIDQVIRLYAV